MTGPRESEDSHDSVRWKSSYDPRIPDTWGKLNTGKDHAGGGEGGDNHLPHDRSEVLVKCWLYIRIYKQPFLENLHLSCLPHGSRPLNAKVDEGLFLDRQTFARSESVAGQCCLNCQGRSEIKTASTLRVYQPGGCVLGFCPILGGISRPSELTGPRRHNALGEDHRRFRPYLVPPGTVASPKQELSAGAS